MEENNKPTEEQWVTKEETKKIGKYFIQAIISTLLFFIFMYLITNLGN
ncbi:MAG: hypothetical protein RR531_01115 [Longicatena sp.]